MSPRYPAPLCLEVAWAMLPLRLAIRAAATVTPGAWSMAVWRRWTLSAGVGRGRLLLLSVLLPSPQTLPQTLLPQPPLLILVARVAIGRAPRAGWRTVGGGLPSAQDDARAGAVCP